MAVATLIICLFGIISIFRVPIQMTPDLNPTSVSVITSWPGATPQDIEKEILVEQEKYLKGLTDLTKLTATASSGRAEVILEFRAGSRLDEILVRVNNALSQVASYPENVDQPQIVTTAASDRPIAWFAVKPLPGNPRNVDIIGMQDFLEDYVKAEFERVPGVSLSEVRGGAARQIRIYVDPAKLAEREITISQLRNAIRARNRDVSGGELEDGKRRFLVRTVGRFQSTSDLENMVIAQRNGTPVHLRDVGYAVFNRADERVTVRHNGELAVAMNVYRAAGTNVLEVMESVQARLAELNATTLRDAGIVMKQVSDDTIYIRESVQMVRDNLILGGVFAAFTLLLFLRSPRATLVGAVGIPVCAIAAFLGLTLAGRTINVISLAGVAFAIGMTLDNSIVVLENIYRHRMDGKSPFEAAYEGVREVWGAVLASTSTTAIVFLPIVFIVEEAGQLFADIAIAISASIIASMFVAILVIPSFAANTLHKLSNEPRTALGRRLFGLFGLAALAGTFRDTTIRHLGWFMGSVLRRILLVLGLTTASLMIAWYLAPKTEYLPDGNQNVAFGIVLAPPGYNLTEMARIGEGMRDIFVPHVDADPAAYLSGEVDIPPIQDFFFISTSQFIIIVTRTLDASHLDALMQKVSSELSQFPGLFAFMQRGSIFARGFSGVRGIDIDISGPDLAAVYDVAAQAFGRTMGVLPGARINPSPGLALGQPLLEVRPDWNRVAELGVDVQDLGYLVWALTDGAFLDEFFLADEKIDMYLYSTQGTVKGVDDIRGLLIYTANGGTVPLGSLAEVVETVNTETIRRVDRQRTVTLSVVPPPDVALERAVEILEQELIAAMEKEGAVPSTVTMRIAGASDKLKATREALGGNFVLAIIIAYLLMVALFSHWGYPFVIMMSVPLGIVGGIVGLHLLNHLGDYFWWLGLTNIYQPLDVLTMLGFVILVGTVVNNPILIVESTLLQMRERGLRPYEAVMESTRNRLRPMMMSTLTTVSGLSPMVFMPGSGAELYRGLGAVVLFGLFFSTLFTLTFIPCLLSLLLELGEYMTERKKKLQALLNKA